MRVVVSSAQSLRPWVDFAFHMLRRCSRRFNAVVSKPVAGSPPPPTTPEGALWWRRRAEAHYALRHTPYRVLPTANAVALIRTGAAVPPRAEDLRPRGSSGLPEGMSEAEALEFLEAAHAAGIVVYNAAEGLVHTRPASIRAEADALGGAAPTAEAQTRAATGAAAAAELDAHIRAARGWKRFWAFVLLGASAQMALFAYLTFIAYGWDTMEPVTYFTGMAYAIVFLAYFYLHRRESTYHVIDRHILSRSLRRFMRK
jgi:hypothetical protein